MRSNALTDQLVYEYLRSLDCPRALTVFILWKEGEHDQLAELEWDPKSYLTLRDARDSLAASKFLSKATFLHTNFDVKKRAIEKFYEAETICRETNFRLARQKVSPAVQCILARMTFLISKFLGDFEADELVDASDWGPGATIHLPRRKVSRTMKFHVERGISPRAYDFVKDWFNAAYPIWDITSIKPVSYNKVVTVPKNAKTDRVIAIEPGLNLWFQKGIGTMIRRRLKNQGIDLNDQSYNQKKARLGSKFNHLATVDFSMASDTISKELVEQVLPPKWLTLLSLFRSSSGLLDSKTSINYEKWSSMGNGYTFELETLIFFIMAVAVCERNGDDTSEISVYGDDVILPSNSYRDYAETAAELGFKVNLEKSYSDSPFRESCGSYFWCGHDIKPIFQKEPLHGQQEILKCANAIRRFARRRNHFGCDRSLRRCWLLLASRANAPVVSENFGDCGLIGNLDEALLSPRPPKKAKHGYEGFYAKAFVVQPKSYQTEVHGLLLDRLTTIGGDKSYSNTVTLIGRFRYSLKWILIPRWEDLGPWI